MLPHLNAAILEPGHEHLHTVARDADEALYECQARFRDAFHYAAIGMALVGLDGRLLDVNPAFCSMLGYCADELRARTFQDLTRPEDLAANLAHARRLLGGEVPAYQMEKRYIHRDGHDVHALLTVSLVRDTAGTPLYFVSQVQDITERRRVAWELDQERACLEQRVAERTADLAAANAELARAVRLKDEFLATISHELRTPLIQVMGLAEGLYEAVASLLPPRQLRSLERIVARSQHLLALINDVLDFTRLGAQSLPLAHEPVLVAELVTSSLELVRKSAALKQLRMEVSCEPGARVVHGDSQRLKQILANLLSNAVKFTADGGTVGLLARSVPERGAIEFVVWDTGAGIPPEQLAQIFQPFVQSEGHLARSHHGTGLGLALVHRLVELHGGAVTVVSKVGVGSCFTVTLPAPSS
jgi:PAS domain S-box-containing protein